MNRGDKMCKCQFPNGIVFKPDGINELVPCRYEDIEIHKNVTVTVSKCKRCGQIDYSWKRQPNTESIILTETNNNS